MENGWTEAELGSQKNPFDFNDKVEMPSIEMGEFKTLCETLWTLRKEYDAIKATLTAKNTEVENLEQKILAYFEQYGLDNFKVPGLCTVGTSTRFQVSMPKDPDERGKFMAYMTANHPDMLVVNHQTLNGFYNSQVESGNIDIPGLAPPTARKLITVRKA